MRSKLPGLCPPGCRARRSRWNRRAILRTKLVDGASEVHMMVLAKFMRNEGRDFWQWGPGEGRKNAP